MMCLLICCTSKLNVKAAIDCKIPKLKKTRDIYVTPRAHAT